MSTDINTGTADATASAVTMSPRLRLNRSPLRSTTTPQGISDAAIPRYMHPIMMPICDDDKSYLCCKSIPATGTPEITQENIAWAKTPRNNTVHFPATRLVVPSRIMFSNQVSHILYI